MADVFFNRTVTVFNHYDGPGPLDDDFWFPTVLNNVRLVETASANLTKNGTVEGDTARLHIMLDDLPKPYLEPVAWRDLLDHEAAFTLVGGRDFFVVGDVSDVSVSVPDFYQYMQQNYDGVYRITGVSKFTVIPHLEVGGR